MSKSREQLNKILAKIDITGKVVLDIGAQDKPTSRLTMGKPKEYYINDIDPQWKPDILADLNDDWDTQAFVKGFAAPKWLRRKYDVIFCIEVLEHCWNPVQAIINMASLLKAGGDIYISAPFINPHHDYWDYMRFTGEWYEKVLDKYGIAIVQIDERVATLGRPLLEQFYAAEGLKISKIRPEYGRYTYPIGYLVHGRKKQTNSTQ